MSTRKPPKRKKLEALPRMRKRLLRKWFARIHEIYGDKCAICGSTDHLNAHHIESKETCGALKLDPLNGILLCVSHHKYGRDSAHRSGVWFATWLMERHPEQYRYIMDHRGDEVDLNSRDVLKAIEERLDRPITEEERLFAHAQ